MKARLEELKKLAVDIPTFRGKELVCSKNYCWRLLVLTGNVSKKRSCKRPADPEKLAQSVRKFAWLVRNKVIQPNHPVTPFTAPYQLASDSQIQQEQFFWNKKKTYTTRKMKADNVAASKKPTMKRQNVPDEAWGKYPLMFRLNVDQVSHVAYALNKKNT